MKTFLLLLIVCLFQSLAFGAIARQKPKKVTECCHGVCVDYCDYSLARIKPGETYQDGCSIARCQNDFSMIFESCGVMMTHECKKFAPDFSLPYPRCCNKVCIEPIPTESEENNLHYD